MGATLSILGLYAYDSSLFDRLVLPEKVDKDTLIENIISECAEFEVLYSDPEYMKYAIGVWSNKELPTWYRVLNTSELEYNPLYNVDATEYTKETRALLSSEEGVNTTSSNSTSNTSENGSNDTTSSGTNKTTESGSSDTTEGGTSSTTESGTSSATESGTNKLTESGSNSNLHKVNGFNQAGLTDSEKDEGANSKTANTTINNTSNTTTSGTNNTTTSGTTNTTTSGTSNTTISDNVSTVNNASSELNTNINRSDTGDIITEHRRYGNIGVTMSQQLVKAELDLAPELNVMNYIIDSFKNRFCLLVY